MKEIKHKERLNRRVFQANVAGHFVLITVSTVFAVLIRSIPAWNWALIYITAAWFARSEWHGMDGAWRGWVLKTLGLGAGSALVFWMAGAFDPIGHAWVLKAFVFAIPAGALFCFAGTFRCFALIIMERTDCK